MYNKIKGSHNVLIKSYVPGVNSFSGVKIVYTTNFPPNTVNYLQEFIENNPRVIKYKKFK